MKVKKNKEEDEENEGEEGNEGYEINEGYEGYWGNEGYEGDEGDEGNEGNEENDEFINEYQCTVFGPNEEVIDAAKRVHSKINKVLTWIGSIGGHQDGSYGGVCYDG